MTSQTNTTPLEAPAPGPLTAALIPERQGEPPLQIDQIQGNIVPGFNKDHQTLLFLRIDDAAKFRAWLAVFIKRVSRCEEVLAFNRLFKRLRTLAGEERGTLNALWTNIAFSFAGLKKLERSGLALNEFVDKAFKDGLLKRSAALGDPVDSSQTGSPTNWLIGGSDSEVEVVLIIAADERSALNDEIARTVESLLPYAGKGGRKICSGASVLFRQDGDTLNKPLTGHEHFGFRDGISQPGVRGLLPDGSPLTPSQNPLNPNQGKPGQDLLWPGEFIFGYPGQDAAKDISEPGADPLDNPARRAPEFARNGSFLVFRRLRQNVGQFHRFLNELGARHRVAPDFVGARMVGRWPSGAPLVVSPTSDDENLASDDCRNNNFEYNETEDDADTPPEPALPLADGVCLNATPPPSDSEGLKAPFAAHIRKAYPRNDTSPTIPQLGESSTQTHRLLRRGIPFGAQSASTPMVPVDDDVDRGLLFLAYQVSVDDQFEFVTRNWANNPNFKQTGVGFDPIIGQNGDPTRIRQFQLGLPGETSPVETDQDWVIPTGGGYFFAPSINGLNQLVGASPEPPPSPAAAAKPAAKSKPPVATARAPAVKTRAVRGPARSAIKRTGAVKTKKMVTKVGRKETTKNKKKRKR